MAHFFEIIFLHHYMDITQGRDALKTANVVTALVISHGKVFDKIKKH